MSDLRELARLPHFRAFLAARIISNLGNGMAPVALAFAVLGLPNATATSLSIILGVQAAVVVAVLPFGGVWADRIGRIRAIAGSDMILGLLLIAQALLFLTHLITVPMLIGVASVTGFLHAIWYPSFTSVAPAVVPADKLQSANSMISGVSAGASILGGASAGLVVATIGAPWALLFDAFTFIVAGALVWTLRSLILPSSSKDTTWQQLKTGWGEFRATRWVFVIVISFAFILMFFYGAHNVLGPVLMKEHYKGATSWAIVITAESVGFLAGAVIGFKIRPRWPMRTAMLAMLTFVSFIGAMALQLPVWAIAITGFFAGVGTEVFQTLWYTTLQRGVPAQSLARISSYDAFGSMLLAPIGLALAGPAFRAWGLAPSLWGAAAVIAVAICAGLAHPSVRLLRSDSPPLPASTV